MHRRRWASRHRCRETPSPRGAHRHTCQFFTPTPTPGHLYVDHNGTFSIYALPLTRLRNLKERCRKQRARCCRRRSPPTCSGTSRSPRRLRSTSFTRRFVRLRRNRAYLKIPLTPAITQIGPSGADLADIEFDPNLNLWLVNNYGGGAVSELQRPLHKYAVAAATIFFGVPGTKAGPYGSLRNARFDVECKHLCVRDAAARATEPALQE